MAWRAACPSGFRVKSLSQPMPTILCTNSRHDSPISGRSCRTIEARRKRGYPMELKFHLMNADGSYTPIIFDPMADAARETEVVQLLEQQAAERRALVAAGKRVMFQDENDDSAHAAGPALGKWMKTTFEASPTGGRIAHVVYRVDGEATERAVTTAPDENASEAVRRELVRLRGVPTVALVVIALGSRYEYRFADDHKLTVSIL